MRLDELIEHIRGKHQLIKPEDRVEVLKLLADKLKNVASDKISTNLLKNLANDGVELVNKKIEKSTIMMDLQKYITLEKSLGLSHGSLASKKDVSDILILIALLSVDGIKALSEKVKDYYIKSNSEEALNWLKKITQGELENAKSRYFSYNET